MPSPPASSSRTRAAAARPCAICGKPAAGKYRPFCSRRCADVDLGRWLNGAYAIPALDTAPDDDDVAAAATAAAAAAAREG